MKIERKQPEFQPITITIETRGELENIAAAIYGMTEKNFEDLKQSRAGIASNYSTIFAAKVWEEIKKHL